MDILPRLARGAIVLGGLLLLAVGASAASGDQPGRGPFVEVPDCRIVSEGCQLDEETPDLNPAGCAVSLAGQLERRGIRTHTTGPVTQVCRPGSDAIVAEATITATCPSGEHDARVMQEVKRVRLSGTLTIHDCSTGEIVGHALTRRGIGWQRRTVIRDLVEELGHHISERKIRKTHPDTPIAWMRGDVGDEYSFELSGGGVSIKRSELNDFLEGAGLDRENVAARAILEIAHHPLRNQHVRYAVGLEAMQVRAEGTGDVAGPALGLGSSVNLKGVRIKADLRVIGVRTSFGYGWDITRNQRIGGELGIGFYYLGLPFFPAEIEVEGIPSGMFRLREGKLGGSAEVRYDWRFTPHLGFAVAGGWNQLTYYNPNRINERHDLPFNVGFTGATARVCLAGRF